MNENVTEDASINNELNKLQGEMFANKETIERFKNEWGDIVKNELGEQIKAELENPTLNKPIKKNCIKAFFEKLINITNGENPEL